MLSRRRFFQCGVALGLNSALPLIAISSAEASPALVALAIASLVAGMIASHNRRDADAYMLNAIREELRVATTQLASLQAAVALVLQDLAKLRNDIEEILRKQLVMEKHAEIRVNVDLYSAEINTRQQYKNDKEWFASSRREETLNRILFDLTKARFALLESSTPSDPNAAIVLSSAALVELSLMNICNTKREVYDRVKMLDTVRQYEDYFSIVKNASIEGSTAWLKDQHTKSKESALSWFQTTQPWVELNLTNGTVDNCVQNIRQSLGLSSNTQIAQHLRYRDFRVLDDPEVRGQLTRMGIVPSISDSPLTIRRLEFTPGPNPDAVELQYNVTDTRGKLFVGKSLLPTQKCSFANDALPNSTYGIRSPIDER